MIKPMNKHKGFTLLELVMTILLMGIISVVVGQILLQGYQIFLTAQNITETDWNGFSALQRLVNDIHTIRSASDISTIQTTQLTFTNTDGNAINYQLSGTTLLRNSQTLATGVQSLAFSYLDKNGATTTTSSDVRFIIITISLTYGNLTQSFVTAASTRGMQ